MDTGSSAQGGLFDESLVERVEQPTEVPMDANGGARKRFKAFEPDAVMLVPPSLEEWLPQGHLARFIAELVDGELDLTRFYASYAKAKGQPPYDPRLMLRILLYGYCVGVRSSRELERACTDVVAFRWLCAQQAPDFRSIARFRERHLPRWPTCSSRRWSSAGPRAWSRWAMSHWTGRRSGPTPRGTRP
jgi:transposase